MFYTGPVELLQYCNNVLAVFCGICIHSHIILRLLVRSDKIKQYHNLLILQSLLYIVDSIITFFIGYIEKTDGDYTFGQPFLPLEKFKRDLCGTAADIILHLELALLASFNIYRTSLIIR
ncbi:hypothetical protein Y032_0009g546 [Ancylostoma ceylanicum]|uniref:7TM GPCR serpentine receptor class x (Srx) domain-containing protein n=1 Tax=Ancylostoma ceylanicum TaxID=53326 RepID=A0A016VK68_9BILA|nr:hypothetical protein Y032_0009g546 [Ancylostoma ceylanicum]